MSAENRLTADQLAALAGDSVTIECAPDSGRTRLMTGTVVRVGPAELFVSAKGRGGGRFLERYSRGNGARTSSSRVELVNGGAVAATTEHRREV